MGPRHLGHIATRLSFCVVVLAGCASQSGMPATGELRQIAQVDGFIAPEAVRYDPDQDVYFVSNWGPGPYGALDNNGFISRMRPDGSLESRQFIAGGSAGVTLHAPRGMTIVGDTLWVADVDAVRGFHRRTGALLASVDFTAFDPGFLNDIAADADGAVYVTDTPRNKVYRVRGGPTLVVSDTLLGNPNGITWDASNRRFLILPFNGGHTIHAWTPGSTGMVNAGTSPGARFDGIEVLSGGRLLVSSQADSSIHLFVGGIGHPIIHISGPPADIAIDTRRNRVAAPIVGLNRVEIWELPR